MPNNKKILWCAFDVHHFYIKESQIITSTREHNSQVIENYLNCFHRCCTFFQFNSFCVFARKIFVKLSITTPYCVCHLMCLKPFLLLWGNIFDTHAKSLKNETHHDHLWGFQDDALTSAPQAACRSLPKAGPKKDINKMMRKKLRDKPLPTKAV